MSLLTTLFDLDFYTNNFYGSAPRLSSVSADFCWYQWAGAPGNCFDLDSPGCFVCNSSVPNCTYCVRYATFAMRVLHCD
jgi:hypothetical protein